MAILFTLMTTLSMRWVPKSRRGLCAIRKCFDVSSLMAMRGFSGRSTMLAMSGSWINLETSIFNIILKVMYFSLSMAWCGKSGSRLVCGPMLLMEERNRSRPGRELTCSPCRHQKRKQRSKWTEKYNLNSHITTEMALEKLITPGNKS